MISNTSFILLTKHICEKAPLRPRVSWDPLAVVGIERLIKMQISNQCKQAFDWVTLTFHDQPALRTSASTGFSTLNLKSTPRKRQHVCQNRNSGAEVDRLHAVCVDLDLLCPALCIAVSY